MTTRYFAVLTVDTPAAPSGICLACGDIMDDSGCRIGDFDREVRPEPVARTGIRRIVEVFCEGTPRHPVQECPNCAAKARRGRAL